MPEISIEDFVKAAMQQNPSGLLRAVSPILNEIRKAQVAKIPRISLLPRNVANCVGLIDRQALVERLPKDAVCVELGVDEGNFSQRILRFSNPRKLYLVDMWATDRFNDQKFEAVTKKFKPETNSGQVEIVRTNSVDSAGRFEDNALDWIYIDTDHSYETTKKELYAYARKIRSGGLIAGHDYCMGNWVSGYKYGVMEAVHEFCVAEDWELVFVTLDFTENQSFAIRRLSPQ